MAVNKPQFRPEPEKELFIRGCRRRDPNQYEALDKHNQEPNINDANLDGIKSSKLNQDKVREYPIHQQPHHLINNELLQLSQMVKFKRH